MIWDYYFRLATQMAIAKRDTTIVIEAYERINAPESTYMFWRDTKSKIDAKISDTEKEISRTDLQLEWAAMSLWLF